MFLHCTEESHQRAEPKVDPIMNLSMREEGKKEVDAYGRPAEERWALSNRIEVTELERLKIMLRGRRTLISIETEVIQPGWGRFKNH